MAKPGRMTTLASPSPQQTTLQESPDAPFIPTATCACGSKEWAPSIKINELDYDGQKLKWYRTPCASCGVSRIERVPPVDPKTGR